jgi:hypothetical protein
MWLDDPGRRSELEREFLRIHKGLRGGGSDGAARAILGLLEPSRA